MRSDIFFGHRTCDPACTNCMCLLYGVKACVDMCSKVFAFASFGMVYIVFLFSTRLALLVRAGKYTYAVSLNDCADNFKGSGIDGLSVDSRLCPLV